MEEDWKKLVVEKTLHSILKKNRERKWSGGYPIKEF
jgi:hypothetical protein